jgi:hypothetical protein
MQQPTNPGAVGVRINDIFEDRGVIVFENVEPAHLPNR